MNVKWIIMISLNNNQVLLNEHCRFKLKSGKEVYGIIWELKMNNLSHYYFTSASLKEKIESSPNRIELIQENGVELDLNDIIQVENLAS